MRTFADGTDQALIPAYFKRRVGYANGRYQTPPAAIEKYDHFLLSVTGDPDAAEVARGLDVERFDATPAQAPGHIQARHDYGHDDATVYCSLDLVIEVVLAIQGAGLIEWPWRLWVAWWLPVPPTRGQIQAALAHQGVKVALRRIWGAQWRPERDYDESVLYGEDDFIPAHMIAAAATLGSPSPARVAGAPGWDAFTPGPHGMTDRAGRAVTAAAAATVPEGLPVVALTDQAGQDTGRTRIGYREVDRAGRAVLLGGTDGQ